MCRHINDRSKWSFSALRSMLLMGPLAALDEKKVLSLCPDLVQTPLLHHQALCWAPFGLLGLHSSALDHSSLNSGLCLHLSQQDGIRGVCSQRPLHPQGSCSKPELGIPFLSFYLVTLHFFCPLSFPGLWLPPAAQGRILKYLSFGGKDHLSNWSVLLEVF